MRELGVPIGIMVMVATMLLSLPTPLLDFLLAANLVLALLLLASTLHVTEPLKLSALPTMLLLATLYRLSLNISTTRLILSQGDAGKVVSAFGSVVMQGSLVVGGVVFLVITIVQFIVIAKGAERVAEVSARFALDAMPGRQMSIDADVRAGLMDFETARRKREELQMESKFYGSLDGAMKFVKGDAIAGIVIVIVNIIGGLTVGLLMDKLSISQALMKYTTLTIGDGLLSQIPSFLNAISAGMVITRVVGGEKRSLASELVGQLIELPSPRMFVGAVSAVLAFIPGLPSIPFIAVGAVLAASVLLRRPKTFAVSTNTPREFKPKVVPFMEISIGDALSKRLEKASFADAVFQARNDAFDKLGILLPPPEVSTHSGSGLIVKLRGISALRTELEGEGSEIQNRAAALLQQLIVERAPEFVDDIMTRRLLDYYDSAFPELISSVVPGIVSVTQLTDVLRNLISEGIPIKNFDLILQSIAESAPKAGSDSVLLEEVRVGLRRLITSIFENDDGEIRAVTLDPVLDVTLATSARERKPVDARLFERIFHFFEGEETHGLVFVVSKQSRRLVKSLLNAKGISLPVLAHEEITSPTRLVSAGHIEFHEEHLKEEFIDALAA